MNLPQEQYILPHLNKNLKTKHKLIKMYKAKLNTPLDLWRKKQIKSKLNSNFGHGYVQN